MKTRTIILFEPRQRLLEKARAYVASPERLLDAGPEAVALLARALGRADERLKEQILLLLGIAPKGLGAWQLYRVMTDGAQSEELRHRASIHLSVAACFLPDPAPLVDRLLEDAGSSDPQLRALAVFALGWEGNERAAIALIDRLYDDDPDVQAMAVNALANLRDDRVVNLFSERLDHAALEQQRCILFNLWRFSARKEKVASIYRDFLNHRDEELRFEALALLGSISAPGEHLEDVSRCLKDGAPRIRALALRFLERLPDDLPEWIREAVAEMRTDPDPAVREAVARIIHRF